MSPAVFGIPLVVIVVVYLIDVGWDSTPRPRDDEEKDSDRQSSPGRGGSPQPGADRGSRRKLSGDGRGCS
jgi:hypothetical protein